MHLRNAVFWRVDDCSDSNFQCFKPALIRKLKNVKILLVEVLQPALPSPNVAPYVPNTENIDLQKLHMTITNKTALACTDTATKRTAMAFVCIFTTLINQFEIITQGNTNRWHLNNNDAREGRDVLEILHTYTQGLSHNTTGEITIFTDLKNTIKWIESPLTASRAAKPCGEIWAQCQRIMARFSGISVIFSHVKGHPTRVTSFNENKEAYLILKCNDAARALRRYTEEANVTINLPIIEQGSIFVNNTRDFRSINAIISTQDAQSQEIEYFRNKFPTSFQFIDIQARHHFPKQLDICRLKCTSGFNHTATREKIFNKHQDEKCDVCGVNETWDHIIRCPCQRQISLKFLETLREKLRKISKLHAAIDTFVSDMVCYIQTGVERGTLALLGHRYVYRGVIVKDWFGADDRCSRYSDVNATLAKLCVDFYITQWKRRNERRNSQVIRKERLLEWAQREYNDPQNQLNIKTARYLQNFAQIRKT